MKSKYRLTVVIYLIIAVSSMFVLINSNYKRYQVEQEQNRIEEAKRLLNIAHDTKDEDDIDNVKDLISLIKNTEVKKELNLNVNSLEIVIDKENILSKYVNMLNVIKKSLEEAKLNKLIEEIKSLKYSDIKKELISETQKIKKLIKAEKERKALQNAQDRLSSIDAMRVISTPPEDLKVLETIVGSVSAYTPFCDGCQGRTASGKYVANGDIYYDDKEFGKVRIIAADPSYPFGTIVRLNNLNYFGESIYAIVLDRGGVIGKGRRRLYDLLFATKKNAYSFGVAYNVKTEILRIGY